MKKTVFILSLVFLFLSCNSSKKNLKALLTGDYDEAIELAVKKLQQDKTSGKNDDRIDILENAFQKLVEQSQSRLALLKNSNSVSATKETYYIYQNLAETQETIYPLLPLNYITGKQATFNLVDYNSDIITAKKDLISALAIEAQYYMDRQTIQDYRTAYNVYCDLEELDPYYPNLRDLKDDAQFYGTDFVLVSLDNRSGQIIPMGLENDLLDFNTYGLDDFWTQYHSNINQNIPYNYGITLYFTNIAISPEKISEKTENRTKKIQDGWEYTINTNSKSKTDSINNSVKKAKYITVSAQVTYTERTKAAYVEGNVIYRDLINNREINRYPLASEFVFENIFARFRGDERALTSEDNRFIKLSPMPFPTSEQMIYDAGEDIKYRLKEILNNNRLR
ncbi:hypothetical protein SCB49_00760 [unidentified eubacterium SCB49]|nr:hypothetical protein SCB49_00760 [unidentified eubacterium SCB49]